MLRWWPAAALLALTTVVTGCGEESQVAVDPDDDMVISSGNACGDVFFWATNADDTVAVTLAVDQRERSTAAPTTASYDVGDGGLEVTILRGTRLSTTFCTDVLIGHPVESEAEATAGHADVRLDPGTPDMLGCGKTSGSVTVAGLTGDGLSFADFTVESDNIGCYAG